MHTGWGEGGGSEKLTKIFGGLFFMVFVINLSANTIKYVVGTFYINTAESTNCSQGVTCDARDQGQSSQEIFDHDGHQNCLFYDPNLTQIRLNQLQLHLIAPKPT